MSLEEAMFDRVEEDLKKDPAFLAQARTALKSVAVQKLVFLALHKLPTEYRLVSGLSLLEQRAFRDAYREGLVDGFEFLYQFIAEESSDGKKEEVLPVGAYLDTESFSQNSIGAEE